MAGGCLPRPRGDGGGGDGTGSPTLSGLVEAERAGGCSAGVRGTPPAALGFQPRPSSGVLDRSKYCVVGANIAYEVMERGVWGGET